MRVIHERLLFRVFASFPFGFVGGVWDLNVLVPGHYLSFFLTGLRSTNPRPRFYLGSSDTYCLIAWKIPSS